LSQKNISILAYSIAIATIVGQLAAFLPNPFENAHDFGRLRGYLSVLWIDVFNSALFYIRIGEGQYFNILVMLDGLLMLTGALLYTTSQGRRIGLLRFMFAIVFVNGVTGFFEGVVLSESSIVFRILSALIWPAYSYGSFLALRALNNTMKIETETNETYGVPMLVDASKGKRFLNLLVDNSMQVLLFSSFMPLYNFTRYLESISSDQIAMTVFYLITRLVYYPFFESVFGATPGKFLTRTTVVDFNTDEQPTFISIVGRTLARFIPFDAFSFAGARGWHDKFSNTRVVNQVTIVPEVAPISGYENVIDQGLTVQ
jgi:uncharacterized RDD family membrane protein YckC